MPKMCKPAYLAKVQQLNEEDKERLLSRMGGKLPKRLEKDKLSQEEALAIQMELEDEQLAEWRKMMSALRQKDAAPKKEAAAKSSGKPKAKSAAGKAAGTAKK